MKTGLGICPRMVVYGPLARGDTPHPTPFGKRPNCLRDCFGTLPIQNQVLQFFLHLFLPCLLAPLLADQVKEQKCVLLKKSSLLQPTRKHAKQMKMDGKFPTKNILKPQLSRLCSDEFLQALACPLSPENNNDPNIEANNETKIRGKKH